MEHQVFEHNLSGGAKGLVVHVPGTQVANLEIRFNSGNQFAPLTTHELPHVLEHLVAAGGTKKFPKHTDLVVEVQKNGAYMNAHTSFEANWYDFEMAEFELERIIDLQEEYFLHKLFRPADLKTEISNVRQELSRNLTNHGRVAYLAYYSASKPGLYLNDADSLATLPNITRQKAIDYFLYTHTLANLRVYLSGNLPDGGIKEIAKLEQIFGRLPAGKRLIPDRAPGLPVPPIAITRDIEQIYFRINWSTRALPLQLQPAASILSSIMGQGFGSRIYGQARKLGLAYELNCGVAYDSGSAELYFGSNVTPENIKPLLEHFTQQMNQIIRGEVTQKEVEATKLLRVGSRIRSTQNSGQLLGWYAYCYEDWDKIEDWDDWNDKLRAVTREQVIEVARHITAKANFGSAFVGPITPKLAKEYAATVSQIGSR